MWKALVFVVCGCGRIGFDVGVDLTGDGGGGGNGDGGGSGSGTGMAIDLFTSGNATVQGNSTDGESAAEAIGGFRQIQIINGGDMSVLSGMLDINIDSSNGQYIAHYDQNGVGLGVSIPRSSKVHVEIDGDNNSTPTDWLLIITDMSSQAGMAMRTRPDTSTTMLEIPLSDAAFNAVNLANIRSIRLEFSGGNSLGDLVLGPFTIVP